MAARFAQRIGREPKVRDPIRESCPVRLVLGVLTRQRRDFSRDQLLAALPGSMQAG